MSLSNKLLLANPKGSLDNIDPHYDNVVFYLKDSIADASKYNHPLVTSGEPRVVSGAIRFNAQDGSTDRLSLTGPNESALNLGNGDFTIESWVFCDRNSHASYEHLFGKGNGIEGGSYSCSVYGGYFTMSSASNHVSIQKITPLLTWQHFAICRINSWLFFYVNGEFVLQSPEGRSFDSASSFNMGDRRAGDSYLQYPFTGSLKELRITKGVARYTKNFTPGDHSS